MSTSPKEPFNVSTFLATYPSIPKADEANLDNVERFNTIIGSKKEWKELTLSERQPPLPKDSVLYQHQKIIERFMANGTPYDELLLFHQPGTGKSITAINMIEKLIGHSVYKKAFIIVPNKTILRQFENEVIYSKATQGKYIGELDEEEVLRYDEQKQQDILFGRAKHRKTYRFKTHETFYRQISSLTPDAIRNLYSNSIFIVDEAHRLLSRADKTWEDTYKTFFRTCKPRKVLLMTGTPMKNDATEIIRLMNLIFPSDYTQPANGGQWIDDFKLKCVGRVSYLRAKSNIPVEFKENRQYSDLPHQLPYPLYYTEMGGVQLNEYNTKADNKQTTFLKDAREISVCSSQLDIDKIDDLNTLGDYSGKYKKIVELLTKQERQNVFIYIPIITSVGAQMLGALLKKLLGFKQATLDSINIQSSERRYAILSDIVTPEVKQLIEIFNDPRNRNGEIIQVLIGGRQIEEGVTFMSVQHIHLLTSPWNYATFDQIIARCVRTRSHRYLTGSSVNVYLHASVGSQDEYIYGLAQDKDKQIKKVEYALKTVAFDCPFTKKRNTLNSKDNSRECDYRECDYKCTDNLTSDTPTNYDTYTLFYQENYIPRMVQILTQMFRLQTTITLFDAVQMFKPQDDIQVVQMLQAFDRIIQQPIPFTDRYGRNAYLHEDDNRFFLSCNATRTRATDSFYLEFPVSRDQRTPLEIASSILESPKNINAQLEQLAQVEQVDRNTDGDFMTKVSMLPLIVQEAFIEEAVREAIRLLRSSQINRNVSSEVKDELPNNVKNILNWYGAYIHPNIPIPNVEQKEQKVEPTYVSTFMRKDASVNVIRRYYVDLDEWVSSSASTELKNTILYFIDRGNLVIGVRQADSSYKIIDLRNVPETKRKGLQYTKGKQATSYQVATLMSIITHLTNAPALADQVVSIAESEGMNAKNALCNKVEELLVENGLMVGDVTE